MTPAEAAEVLTVASAFDNRAVAEGTAQAWSAALPWITCREGKDAVVAHYGSSTAYVLPGHVAALAKARRAAQPDPLGIPAPEGVPRPAWFRERFEAHLESARETRGVQDGPRLGDNYGGLT